MLVSRVFWFATLCVLLAGASALNAQVIIEERISLSDSSSVKPPVEPEAVPGQNFSRAGFVAPERGIYMVRAGGWGTVSSSILRLYAHVSDGRCLPVPSPPSAYSRGCYCHLPQGADPDTYREYTEFRWGKHEPGRPDWDVRMTEMLRLPMDAGQSVLLTYGACSGGGGGEPVPPFAMPEVSEDTGIRVGGARLRAWTPEYNSHDYSVGHWTACWCHRTQGASFTASTLNVEDRFFEAPASGIALAVPDTLDWGTTGIARASAVHPDGAPAPWDRSPFTFRTSSPAWLSASGVSGTSVTTAAGGASAYLRTSSEDARPCDFPLTVSVSGGGFSDSKRVIIRGTGEADTTAISDTLYVSAFPSPVQSGSSADVRVSTVLPGACAGGADTTRVSIGLSSTSYGVLEYEDQRGAAVYDIPLDEASSGAVRFVADGAAPCDTTEVGVFAVDARGRRGIGSVAVVGDTTVSTVGRDDGVCLPEEQRARALWELLEEDPYGLLDVPCDQIRDWLTVGDHRVPDEVLRRLESIRATLPTPFLDVYWSSYPHQLTDATGGVVNMDYFSLTVTRLPGNMSAIGTFEHMRKSIRRYLDPSYADLEAYPVNNDAAAEWAKWGSNNPLGTVMTFTVKLNGAPVDDASVVMSDYERGRRWRFSTAWTPEGLGHPVSGTREFGMVDNGDGTWTFYTRGVDRLTSWVDVVGGAGASVVPGVLGQFESADALWVEMMRRAKRELERFGGAAEENGPVTYRPDWEEFRSYFESGVPTADELLDRIGCENEQP